jgi:hypothetical protein
MPNRWPINSGSWSDSAIWSGSIIPTASDDVFLNNQTITLDQNVTVRTIRNSATGSAVVNGRIQIYNDFNITATTGYTFNQITAAGVIQNYGTGSITITGPMSFTNSSAIYNYSIGTINLIGDVSIGNQGGTVIVNGSNGIINLIGNLSLVAGAQANVSGLVNILNGIINVTGNITGGSGANNNAAVNSSTGTINITGNITGGTGTTSHGISNTSIGIINITGTCIAGTSTGAGINSTTAGIINVIGQLQASTTANAISSTSTTATNIFTGPLINSGSRNAIYCYNVQLYDNVTTSYRIGVSGSTDTITLYSPNQIKVPTQNNVRKGITYGVAGEFTGSMNVPNPQSVSYGVAVDNTTGSAVVTPTDLWNYTSTLLTASNSIGQRLANTLPSQSMTSIVNAFTN